MKDQGFGLELEFTGISRERAAKLIAEVAGGQAKYFGGTYKEWHVYAPDGRKWKVVYDGSIDVENSPGGRWTGEQCEFVTPVCKYEDIELIQNIVRRLRKGGATVNKSCGIHIHLGAQDFTAASLRNLMNMFKSKQDMLYRALKVRNEHLGFIYSRKLLSGLVEEVNRVKPKSLPELQRIWYSDKNYRSPHSSWRNDPGQHYNETRYNGLNLHNVWYRGTVEFRIFNATLHAGEVKAYIQLALAMGHKAKTSSRMSAQTTTSANEKFTFRTWLLSLGMIGDEFKTAREHLLKHLDGNAAWRYVGSDNRPIAEHYPTVAQLQQFAEQRAAAGC